MESRMVLLNAGLWGGKEAEWEVKGREEGRGEE